MSFCLRKHSIPSHFRSHSQDAVVLLQQNSDDAFSIRSRGFHVEPGPREKALLADDPAISRFKSFKKSASNIKRIGDVLTIVVVAGCCYEVYVRATLREEGRRKARESA